MPFLLCFSYRLYYQYIFIYFSATKKAIHHSFVDTERNTVPTTSTKPISSTTVNLVPRTNAERIVADAGSRQPSSVDFTGPIYFTLSRNTEKPTAVPIITITAMMIQAGSSRFVGKIHALVKKKSTLPPINIPHPVIVRFPQDAIIGRDKSV